MDDTTPEQTEMLLQFQDLTGIDSLNRCKEILVSYQWNLEMAVQDQFNQNEGRAPVAPPPPATPGQFQTQDQQVRELTRPVPLNVFHPNQRIYYASAVRRPMDWITWLKWLFALPFTFTFQTVIDIFVFFYRFFVPDPRSRITDPYGDVRAFIDKFEELYGFVHPHFERMTCSQALQKAKTEFRFLIVYLTDFSNEECRSFNTNCLVNPEVYEYINNNALFWGCSVETPEGFRITKILRTRYEPFVAVVCLRDNRLTVVGRIEGAQTAEAFLQRIRRIINDNTSYVRAARSEADDRNLSRLLRDQQDDAYQQSLRKDREKAKEKAAEELKKQQEAEAIKLQKDLKKQKKAETKLLKQTMKDSFPPELDANETDALPIAFKMPSGERVNRVFNCHDSLHLLRNYVYCQPNCPPRFDIMKSFPRKCLPHPDTASSEEMDQTLKGYGLSKNEMLFVQQTFVSDDESETGESIAESTTSSVQHENLLTGDDGEDSTFNKTTSNYQRPEDSQQRQFGDMDEFSNDEVDDVVDSELSSEDDEEDYDALDEI